MSLSASDKEFVAVGAAIGAGCHPCTQYHTQAALKAGLGAKEVLWAIQQAQVARARGGIAVANVGRRILGAEQQELTAVELPASRDAVLARLGAAVGCNSGVLLAEYAGQAAGLGIDGGELRESFDIAEMVKTQAGKFLGRDVERVLEQAFDATVAGPPAGCCPPEGASEPAEAGAAAAVGDCSPGCGREEEQ